jgi:hypothetical protein
MFVNISDTRPITASAFRWRPCRLSRAVFALLRPPLLRRPPFSGGRGRPPRTATALRPRTGLNVRAIFFENPNHQRQVTTSITKSFSPKPRSRRGFPPPSPHAFNLARRTQLSTSTFPRLTGWSCSVPTQAIDTSSASRRRGSLLLLSFYEGRCRHHRLHLRTSPHAFNVVRPGAFGQHV